MLTDGRIIGFKQMVDDHHYGSRTTKSVENWIVRFSQLKQVESEYKKSSIKKEKDTGTDLHNHFQIK